MHGPHKYSLLFDDSDPPGVPDSMDMEAEGPEAALSWAAQRAPGRSFDLLQDGQGLCHVHQSDRAYWTIEPARNLRRKG